MPGLSAKQRENPTYQGAWQIVSVRCQRQGVEPAGQRLGAGGQEGDLSAADCRARQELQAWEGGLMVSCKAVDHSQARCRAAAVLPARGSTVTSPGRIEQCAMCCQWGSQQGTAAVWRV